MPSLTYVVLAADARYLDYAGCSLAQLALHGRAAEGVLLLVPPELTETDSRPIRQQARKLRIDLSIVPMTEIAELQSRGAVASRGHVSTFTYSKLFMAEVLQDVDEVLYLDIDTLVRDDLTDLLNHRLQHPIGAVRELGNNGKRIFGSTRVPYFNAGVLRMSLSRFRDEDFITSALDVLRRNPRLQFQDQDVLNMVFRDRHDALPLAYNVFDSFSEAALPAWKILDDPVIVHFVGQAKPWQSNATSRHAREWRRVHAGLLGLSAKDAQLYSEGASATWQERVHGAIVSARHSRGGQVVRSSLPLGLKDGLNRGLLALLPHRSILADQVLKAMNEPPRAAPLDPVEPQPLVKPDIGPANRAPGSQSVSRNTVDEASGSGPLLLVLSLPRSGTNALGSMLRTGIKGSHVEGELYLGHMRPQTRERLRVTFPWVDAPPTAFHRLVNDHAVAVTTVLLAGRSTLTVVKILPNQLEEDSLIEVLQGFNPRVIVLRRRLAFSYMSWVKAYGSGRWFHHDTTDVSLRMSDDVARQYIQSADEWFTSVATVCSKTGVETLDLTYDHLFDSDQQHGGLLSFLPDCDFRKEVIDSGSLRPSSVRQDRRTDGSLAVALREFGNLAADVREELLRYPGPPMSS